MKEKTILFIILAVVFYFMASFINMTLDITNWGIFTRVVYSLGFIVTASSLFVNEH